VLAIILIVKEREVKFQLSMIREEILRENPNEGEAHINYQEAEDHIIPVNDGEDIGASNIPCLVSEEQAFDTAQVNVYINREATRRHCLPYSETSESAAVTCKFLRKRERINKQIHDKI